jgi:hypothetical protein
LGKTYGPAHNSREIEFAEYSQIRNSFVIGGEWEPRLAEWARNLDFSENPLQFISDEGLMVWRSPRRAGGSAFPVDRLSAGDTPRKGAHPITIFLAHLANSLPTDVSLFTIVTLRNQPDYLGSHAAQRGRTKRWGAQDVMDRVADYVIESKDAFIDFHSLVTDLERINAPSKHLTLLFEDGVEHNCKTIVEFGALQPREESFNYDFENPENVRRMGDDTWRVKVASPPYRNSPLFLRVWRYLLWGAPLLLRALRALNIFVTEAASKFRQPPTVSVSQSARIKLRAFCAPSNQLLAEHLKRDLVSLGY